MEELDIKDMLLKRIDLRGLIVEDVMQAIIKKKMEEFVKDSENTYDDALYNLLYPMLEEEVIKKIDELLAKIAE